MCGTVACLHSYPRIVESDLCIGKRDESDGRGIKALYGINVVP